MIELHSFIENVIYSLLTQAYQVRQEKGQFVPFNQTKELTLETKASPIHNLLYEHINYI